MPGPSLQDIAVPVRSTGWIGRTGAAARKESATGQVAFTASISRRAARAGRLRTMAPLLISLLASSLLLGGCHVFQAPVVARGNRIDPDALKELVPGTSSRVDVVSLIGSPTAKATFDENRWIYIGQETRIRIGRTPGVLSQDVVVLTFDDKGTLLDVKHLNQDDSRRIAMASGATPSPGSEASFLQQLLGNVGRFNAGGGGGAVGQLGAGGTGLGNP